MSRRRAEPDLPRFQSNRRRQCRHRRNGGIRPVAGGRAHPIYQYGQKFGRRGRLSPRHQGGVYPGREMGVGYGRRCDSPAGRTAGAHGRAENRKAAQDKLSGELCVRPERRGDEYPGRRSAQQKRLSLLVRVSRQRARKAERRDLCIHFNQRCGNRQMRPALLEFFHLGRRYRVHKAHLPQLRAGVSGGGEQGRPRAGECVEPFHLHRNKSRPHRRVCVYDTQHPHLYARICGRGGDHCD